MDLIGQALDLSCTILTFEPLPNKIKKLRRLGQNLEDRVSDITTTLDNEEDSSSQRRSVVNTWLANADTTTATIQQTCDEFEAMPWFAIHRLALMWREVSELMTLVQELIDGSAFPEGLTIKIINRHRPLPALKEPFGHMFEMQKRNVLDYLRDDNVSKIGICGMGGIGKTTLAKHIHNQLQSNRDISVFWVQVSMNFSISKLQGDIARKLNLSLVEEDDQQNRAAQLLAVLNRKKSVLFLDDVWEFFPLEDVGVLAGSNGCKVILISRQKNVCRIMHCEKIIELEPLSKEEGRQLFRANLWGRLPPQFEDFADLVADECAGLPLGIIVAAKSIIVDREHVWRNFLKNMTESRAIKDMDEKVFDVLKQSYDMLQDSKLQQCLLYCSLYPDDFEIEKEALIGNFIDEGLIDRMENRHTQINEGLTLLRSLEDACLLMGGKRKFGKEYVKMHYLVRDMAIKITTVNPRFLVKARKGLAEVPKDDEWDENLLRTSLMSNTILTIPSTASPRCPRLETLLLSENFTLDSVSSSFFGQMEGLKVLDLSDTSITNLPASVSNLKSLISLLLRRCWRLKDVLPLANLKTLERLDLFKAGITEFPRSMEELVELRYLNLDTRHLKLIHSGVLSKLTRLQYLVVHEFVSYASQLKGEEIAFLKELETFKGEFGSVDDMNAYVRSRGQGGTHEYFIHVVESGTRYVNSLLQDSVDVFNKAVSLSYCTISGRGDREQHLLLPGDIELLDMKKCNNVTCLCHVAKFGVTVRLKKYVVDWCMKVKHVICCSVDSPVFDYLESLSLQRLKALQGLTEAFTIQNDIFSRLKEFEIFGCPKIKSLFTPLLFSNLRNLESLKVNSCENLVEVIEHSAVGDDNNQEARNAIYALPKLRVLELVDLPEFESLGDKRQSIIYGSLECAKIQKCPKLRRISLSPSPKKIEVEEKWWDSLELDQPNMKDALQTLCEFIKEQPSSSSA
ncbi:AAA+ ATPase domain containing protein [Trema orientale]|uniref:AAA+ ATPase domain containing protein n=1 Tax=Trema orientale TaxID=63057 RepID=A0A2P5FLQ6_TREOI|nr:AAA+ ATPase domain containing protein [Trema orientale]